MPVEPRREAMGVLPGCFLIGLLLVCGVLLPTWVSVLGFALGSGNTPFENVPIPLIFGPALVVGVFGSAFPAWRYVRTRKAFWIRTQLGVSVLPFVLAPSVFLAYGVGFVVNLLAVLVFAASFPPAQPKKTRPLGAPSFQPPLNETVRATDPAPKCVPPANHEQSSMNGDAEAEDVIQSSNR